MAQPLERFGFAALPGYLRRPEPEEYEFPIAERLRDLHFSVVNIPDALLQCVSDYRFILRQNLQGVWREVRSQKQWADEVHQRFTRGESVDTEDLERMDEIDCMYTSLQLLAAAFGSRVAEKLKH